MQSQKVQNSEQGKGITRRWHRDMHVVSEKAGSGVHGSETTQAGPARHRDGNGPSSLQETANTILKGTFSPTVCG